MKRFLGSALVALVVSAGAIGAAQAQPVSKLTTNLGKALTQAMWCSALLLEEAAIFEEGSEAAVEYEDLAYDLGGKIDALLEEQGFNDDEIDELWALFDEAAIDFALDDEYAFYEELANCEDNYHALLS